MGYGEKSVLTAPAEHKSAGQRLAEKSSAIWCDEHRHACLTAILLLLTALLSHLAGLSIAPIACVVFAIVLLVADLRARFGPHR